MSIIVCPSQSVNLAYLAFKIRSELKQRAKIRILYPSWPDRLRFMTPTCKAVTTLSELKQLSTSVLLRAADSCFQFRKLKILPFQRRVFQKDQCHLNSSTNSKTGSWHALKHLPADAQTAAERCKQDCLDWTKSRQTPGVQNKNSLHLQDISEYLTSCVFLSRPILCDRQTNRRTGLLTCPWVLTVKCGLKNHVLSLTKTFKVCVCACVCPCVWARLCERMCVWACLNCWWWQTYHIRSCWWHTVTESCIPVSVITEKNRNRSPPVLHACLNSARAHTWSKGGRIQLGKHGIKETTACSLKVSCNKSVLVVRLYTCMLKPSRLSNPVPDRPI